MGVKTMKKYKLYLIFVICAVLQADEIDEIINKINSQRVSNISKKEIKSLQSPIAKVEIIKENNNSEGNITIVKSETEVYNLGGILNNSAFINGKWVRKGQQIGPYKLVEIMEDSVVLKSKNKTKLIFFKKNNGKIKIITGGKR
jgi:hypothetical protein